MREEARYEYHLDQNSIVLDIGAYQGKFAIGIFDRYRPIIHCFEPVARYYKELCANTSRIKVALHNYGVGPCTELAQIHIAGDRSSVISGLEQCEMVQIRSISEIWHELQFNIIDLVKINIEGMEYDLLEHITVHDLHLKMKNLQIQFHEIPGYELRLASIREALQKTHHLTYCWHMIWENWELSSVA